MLEVERSQYRQPLKTLRPGLVLTRTMLFNKVVPRLPGDHRGEGGQLQRAAQPTLHQHQESYDVPVCQPEGQGLPGPEDL